MRVLLFLFLLFTSFPAAEANNILDALDTDPEGAELYNPDPEDELQSGIEPMDDVKMLATELQTDRDRERALWPMKALIPLSVEPGLPEELENKLLNALRFFHNRTNIRFVRNTNYSSYVSIRHSQSGCFSETLGKKGGKQIVNIGVNTAECWRQGVIIHQLMHVLGFYHEQSRHDRDEHLNINWHNIPNNLQQQLQTSNKLKIGFQHGRYDYESVMQHSAKGMFNKEWFSAVKNPISNNGRMGNRKIPSERDVDKINQIYSNNGNYIWKFYCPWQKRVLKNGKTKVAKDRQNAILVISLETANSALQSPEVYFPDFPGDNTLLDTNENPMKFKTNEQVESGAIDNHKIWLHLINSGSLYFFDLQTSKFDSKRTKILKRKWGAAATYGQSIVSMEERKTTNETRPAMFMIISLEI